MIQGRGVKLLDALLDGVSVVLGGAAVGTAAVGDGVTAGPVVGSGGRWKVSQMPQ